MPVGCFNVSLRDHCSEISPERHRIRRQPTRSRKVVSKTMVSAGPISSRLTPSTTTDPTPAPDKPFAKCCRSEASIADRCKSACEPIDYQPQCFGAQSIGGGPNASAFEPIIHGLLGLGLRIRHRDRRSDPTPSSPTTLQLGRARRSHRHEVIKNAIRDVFVEDAFVSKPLQIELQTFQFHTQGIGHVAKDQRAKIRLPGHGTNRSELRADDLDRVVPLRIGVLEALKGFDKRCTGHVFGFRCKDKTMELKNRGFKSRSQSTMRPRPNSVLQANAATGTTDPTIPWFHCRETDGAQWLANVFVP
jgi:hypothetical protein